MKALNWANRVGTYNLGSSKRMQYESTLPEYFHNLTVIQQFFRCFNWVKYNNNNMCININEMNT